MNFHLHLRAIAPATLLAGAVFVGLRLTTAVPSAPLAASEHAAISFAEPVARALLDEASATRSYAYYPEQLAALSSLKSFAPVADPGRSVLVAPAAARDDDPPPPRKRASEAPRRTETPGRADFAAAGAPVAAAAPVAGKSQPQTRAKPESWKLFGLAVPNPGWPDGESVRAEAVKWRNAAASLPEKAAAFGDHLVHLWR